MPRKRKRYRPAVIRLRTDQYFGFPEEPETEEPVQARSYNQMAGIIYLPGVAGTAGSQRQQYANFGQRHTGEMLRSRGPIESGGVAQSGVASQPGFVLAVFSRTASTSATPRLLATGITQWSSSLRTGMNRSVRIMPGSVHGAATNMDGVIHERGSYAVGGTQYIAEADCNFLAVGYPLDHESERSGTGYFAANFVLDDVDSGLTQSDLTSGVELSVDIGLATTAGSVGDPIVSGNAIRITQRFWEGFGSNVRDNAFVTITGAAPNGWANELINSAIGTSANNVWRLSLIHI